MMHGDAELLAQVDADWFDEHAERLQRTHDRIRNLFWRLTHSWADGWKFGAGELPPDPVPNPSMRWVRPSFAATVHRQWAFEHMPEVLLPRHRRCHREEWYRLFGNDIPEPQGRFGNEVDDG